MVLILGLMILTTGCTTTPVIPADYSNMIKNVEDISNAGNITPEQKEVLQHTIAGLNQLDELAKENATLRDDVISASKTTSRVIYVIVGGAIIIIILLGISRLLRPV
jgi:hypothetical protein